MFGSGVGSFMCIKLLMFSLLSECFCRLSDNGELSITVVFDNILAFWYYFRQPENEKRVNELNSKIDDTLDKVSTGLREFCGRMALHCSFCLD